MSYKFTASREAVAVQVLLNTTLQSMEVPGQMLVKQGKEKVSQIGKLPLGNFKNLNDGIIVPVESVEEVSNRISSILTRTDTLAEGQFTIKTLPAPDWVKGDVPQVKLVVEADLSKVNVDAALAFLKKGVTEASKIGVQMLENHGAEVSASRA